MEKNIRDLVLRVARTRQLDLNEDAVVAYQDLIGHATVEENRELSNTPELTETFYWIYGAAYGTVGAIKFYLNNSNKIFELQDDLAEYEAKLKDAENMAEKWESLARTKGQHLNKCEEEKTAALKEVDACKAVIETQEREITRLKAQLFDLMEEVEVLRRKLNNG